MATDPKKKSEQLIVIKDVRMSFPHLFDPQERTNDDGSVRSNYNCVFMIPKDHPQIGKIKASFKTAGNAARKRAWGDDESKWPNIPSHMICFKDGDNPDHTDRAEYAGHFFVNSSSPIDKPPSVLTNRKDSDDKWMEARPGQKGAPYAGCYVNGIIEVWAQKKDAKKNIPNRLNSSVQTVQFRRDGTPFSAQPVDPNDYLDDDDVSYEGDIGGDDDGDEESLI
jgi:hypothetical protein